MYNLISYTIYISVIVTVILYVGHVCYKNGQVYVFRLIPNELELSQQINKTLLVGYYLVNLGYSVYAIALWEPVNSTVHMILSVSNHLATIMLLLAVLHYSNILIINLLLKLKTTI